MNTFSNKYAPKSFDDLVIANPMARKRLQEFAENKRHSSIILHGPFGTAKSTTARILAESRSGESARPVHACKVTKDSFDGMINEQKIQQMMQGVELPVTIIDEIDQVDKQLQYRLREELDRDPAGGCFVFTTNRLHAVDSGLVDRCSVVELPAIDAETWLQRAQWILEQEGVVVNEDGLRDLLSAGDGSIRTLMQALEDLTLRMPKAA